LRQFCEVNSWDTVDQMQKSYPKKKAYDLSLLKNISIFSSLLTFLTHNTQFQGKATTHSVKHNAMKTTFPYLGTM
jgi:hypothetical protein